MVALSILVLSALIDAFTYSGEMKRPSGSNHYGIVFLITLLLQRCVPRLTIISRGDIVTTLFTV